MKVKHEVKKVKKEPTWSETFEGTESKHVTPVPAVKIVFTDEEREALVRFKNMGNMSQPDAAEYHKLLNKEAGIPEVV